MNKLYFLDQDNSCHWYLVEAAHRAEWDAWRDLPEEDENCWNTPPYAKALGGGPSQLLFEHPVIPA